MKKTSIIILSYNTAEMLKLCLESIRAYTPAGSYEVVVVDNGSKDGSLAYLRSQTDVRLIENQENRGFPAGCNQGMQAAAAENDLLLLNSDTIVTPHWLENLQAALRSAENVGAVSCVTNNCSNFQSIPAQYANLEEMLSFAERFNVQNPACWFPWLTLVAFVLLVKREAYEEVGGFDEAFSPGNYEDDDYSLRLRQAGWQLLLAEDTFVHHFGSASFRKGRTLREEQARERQYRALSERNHRYLIKKHRLPQDYKTKHGIVDALPDDLPAGTRVLLVNCSLGNDLCLLKSRMPQVMPAGITFDQRAAERGLTPYPLVFADGYGSAAAVVRKQFSVRPDAIILLGNMREVPEAEQVIAELLVLVGSAGLYYGDAEHVWCRKPENGGRL